MTKATVEALSGARWEAQGSHSKRGWDGSTTRFLQAPWLQGHFLQEVSPRPRHLVSRTDRSARGSLPQLSLL